MVIASVCLWLIETNSAIAQQHQLRSRGRTLVEAESCSQMSADTPRKESSPWCSGQKNLGFFFNDAWFEMSIEVPKMLNYGISLRTSSPEGTQIEVQLANGAGLTTLAKIDVPNTRQWTNYVDTESVILSLPAGVHTLRFANRGRSLNIDYLTFLAGPPGDVTATEPIANTGPGSNPLKGFMSANNRTNDDFASVGFQQIEWGRFEPKDDVFDWDYVERVLDQHGTQGRHFILQFVVDRDAPNEAEPIDNSHYVGPDWLLSRVGENRGPVDETDKKSRITRATRYNDRVFIEEATEAIEQLLNRYRDDPRAFIFQAGILGFEGQWGTSPRNDWKPSPFTKSAILNAYHTNLSPDGFTQLYGANDPDDAPRKGIGYWSRNGAPSRQGYNFGERISNRKLWNDGPIGGAWPADMESNVFEKFFQTEEGVFFIEKGHFTTLIVPEASKIQEVLPGWEKDDRFWQMHRRAGYNFQIKQVRHLAAVDESKHVHIECEIENIGIAPFYKKWIVQLGVLDSQSWQAVDVKTIDTDIRQLGPSESMILRASSSTKLDANVQYQIGFRIIQSGAEETKASPWKLNARNVYIALANELKVVEGVWDDDPQSAKRWSFEGGWNLLGAIQRTAPKERQPIDGEFFPFQGSFRP